MISGGLYIGMGDTFDQSKTKLMPQGSFGFWPAGMHHFGYFEVETVLQLHGELDNCVLPETARGSGRYVSGEYEWLAMPGVGHFPHEEAPDATAAEIIREAQS